jgi:hypothetical protein
MMGPKGARLKGLKMFSASNTIAEVRTLLLSISPKTENCSYVFEVVVSTPIELSHVGESLSAFCIRTNLPIFPCM